MRSAGPTGRSAPSPPDSLRPLRGLLVRPLAGATRCRWCRWRGFHARSCGHTVDRPAPTRIPHTVRRPVAASILTTRAWNIRNVGAVKHGRKPSSNSARETAIVTSGRHDPNSERASRFYTPGHIDGVQRYIRKMTSPGRGGNIGNDTVYSTEVAHKNGRSMQNSRNGNPKIFHAVIDRWREAHICPSYSAPQLFPWRIQKFRYSVKNDTVWNLKQAALYACSHGKLADRYPPAYREVPNSAAATPVEHLHDAGNSVTLTSSPRAPPGPIAFLRER